MPACHVSPVKLFMASILEFEAEKFIPQKLYNEMKKFLQH
jgi:hypothetical protein